MKVQNRKNIILISVDNLRADCIEFFSNKKLLTKYNLDLSLLHTPTLNSLIEKGIFFESCFTASSYTTASHASILTGCYPISTGVQEYFKHRINKYTIFELVKKQYGDDYKTFFYTDFPFILGNILGFDKGVDFYNEQNEFEIIDAIKKNVNKSNFVAFFHFSNVHTPYGISSIKLDGYRFSKEVRILANEFKIKSKNVISQLDWLERDRDTKESTMRKIYHEAIEKIYAQKDFQRLMKMYLMGVSYFDTSRLKIFIENLKESGIFEKSVIILFSDHGERWDHDSHGHHDNLYDDTIRIPLIILGAGIASGLVIKKQVRSIDIIPSVAKMLSIEDKTSFDGKSLFPISSLSSRNAIGEIWTSKNVENTKKVMWKVKDGNLLSEVAEKDDFLWKEYIRTGKYKLINEYKNKKKITTKYKIINGCEEVSNQISKKIINKLQQELDSYRQKKAPQKTLCSQTQQSKNILRNQLKSLGYNV